MPARPLIIFGLFHGGVNLIYQKTNSIIVFAIRMIKHS
jgi:hypothetical protein